MSPRAIDEETPMLQAQKQENGRTPLPWRQLCIIIFLGLAGPFAAQVIAPFAPQLIRDIGITNGDETQVGYYVGFLHSLFFASQAFTVLYWSQLSDRVGRKPVLLIGLFSSSIAMCCFGLSTSFLELMISRSLSGALNGNAGVMKSMMMEMTDTTNSAQAYSFTSIAWLWGSTLGPYVGGSLSRPADRFPEIFRGWAFFRAHPYFLACAVPATFAVIAWLIAFVFLKETLPHCEPFAQYLKAKFARRSSVKSIPPTPNSSSRTFVDEDIDATARGNTTPLPLRAVLVPRVLIAAGNYATLSLMDNTFRTIQPLFLATPIELGGLGLDPPQIGNILSISGMANGLFQILFFAKLHDQFGTKAVYTAAVASALPVTLVFPLINALARLQGLSRTVWFMVGIQLALMIILNTGYSCVFIYIKASSPNRASLGATNGIAQILVSTMRAIGPASGSSMFSISLGSPDRAWFVYYYLILLVCIGIGASLWLPRKVWTPAD